MNGLEVLDLEVDARIKAELAYARKKFPHNTHMLAALTEEVGELAKALLEHHRGELPREDVLSEAVQVAAMAIRVATEGDASFNYRMPGGAADARGAR